MLCLNCNRELDPGQERCPDCGEKIDPEAVAASEAAARQVLSQMPPEALERLRSMADSAETAETFANMIMIGDCVDCGSANVLCCEHDPDIADPCIAYCHDCGKYWCTECGKILATEEFETHAEICPEMADLDPFDDEAEYDVEDGDETGGELMGVESILSTFADQSRRVYPRAALDSAVARQDEITPVLLQTLQEVLDDPESFAECSRDMRPTFAVLLLGLFCEPKAHPLLVDLLCLPDGGAYAVFGECITEDFAAMLVRTFPGSPEALVGLLCNTNLDQFERGAGARALICLVAEGRVERSVVVEALRSLLSEALEKEDTDTATLCVDAAISLHPAELLPLIRRGYELDLVDPFMAHPEDLEEALLTSPDDLLQEAIRDQRERHPNNIHAWCSWWAMYDDVQARRRRLFPVPPSKAGTKKKAKRKAARKARKKNRRRGKKK